MSITLALVLIAILVAYIGSIAVAWIESDLVDAINLNAGTGRLSNTWLTMLIIRNTHVAVTEGEGKHFVTLRTPLGSNRWYMAKDEADAEQFALTTKQRLDTIAATIQTYGRNK